MITQTTDRDTSAKRETSATENGRDALASAGSTISTAVTDAAAAVPGVIDSSRDTIDQVARRLSKEPDQNLAVFIAFSIGTGFGLLVGGAPRMVAVAGLLPAIAIGLAILGRSDRTPSS